MLIRDDKSRILPARTGSLRTTRLVPSAAPLVVTATTRGSGTGVPRVTAEDTEHGDLKPAPDPQPGSRGAGRGAHCRRPVPGSRGAVAPRRAAGGREAATRGLPCAWPLVQPCAPAPSAAAALSSAPRLRVPSRGALRLSHCVSEFRAWRQRGPLPASLGDSPPAVRSDTPGARRGFAAWSVLLLPPPRVLPPGGPPLGGADTQRLPRLAAGAEPPSPPPGRSPRRPPVTPPVAPPPLVLAAHSFAPLLLPGPSPWSAQSALPRGLNA